MAGWFQRPWRVYCLRVILGMALIGAAVVSITGHIPPAAKPATAPERDFSAYRALAHVRAMARKPHPAGTAENTRVRDYVMDQLRALGLDPQIQAALSHRGPGQVAMVENVLARIPGVASTGAAVFLAHYDSVAFGPGAADDIAGVSALLETIRAVKAGPPLKNDLIFLFTDGEEGRILGKAGLRGAWAFVHKHPWAKDVKIAVNFDCRGTEGPSYMYECSAPNRWLVRQLNLADTKPIATSMMFEIYHRMPVGSDLTMFLEEGIPGMNFAFISGLKRYHTALDAPELLSRRSLQHHGNNALGLARQLGNVSLDMAGKGGNSVYFHFPLIGMIQYGLSAVWPMCLAALVLYGTAIGLGLRRGRMTLRGLAAGAGIFMAVLLLCAAAGGAVFWFTYQAHNFYFVYDADPWFGALLCATFALFCLVMGLAWRRLGAANLAAGALLPWAMLLLLSTGRMPGASYIFFIPLVMGALTLLWLVLRPVEPHEVTWKGVVLLGLTGLPAMFFITGVMQGLHASILLVGAPGQALLLVLLLGAVLPQLIWTAGGHLRTAASVFFGATLAVVAVALFPAWNSADRPKVNSLTYALDTTRGQAFWLSCDARPDAWNSPYLGEDPVRAPINDILTEATRGDYLRAAAPTLDIAPPTAEMVSDTTQNGLRTLRLRLDSPRKAQVLEVRADSGLAVTAARLNGAPLLPMEAGNPWALTCSIYRGGGLDLELDVPAGAPVSLRITDHSYGLPDALEVAPRPVTMIPKPNTMDYNKDPLKTDETVVTRMVVF